MLGNFLRATRKAKNQTQAEAAAAVGVHPMTWSTWERGLRPDLALFFKIADWAGVSTDHLRRVVEAA